MCQIEKIMDTGEIFYEMMSALADIFSLRYAKEAERYDNQVVENKTAFIGNHTKAVRFYF